MALKLFFLATDKQDKEDLWCTDGTTTKAIGGIGDLTVGGSSADGLGPTFLAAVGQQMFFAGSDLDDYTALWVTDDSSLATTEVGGVVTGKPGSSKITGGSDAGLEPSDFVAYGNGQALFYGNDATGFTGLWSTDGTAAGTVELGGTGNRGVANVPNTVTPTWDPTYFGAFNNQVLFTADDNASGGYSGLWITDGTTAGTQEIGGPQNAAIYDSNASRFDAIDYVQLGDLMLFSAQNKAGDQALWETDGTAAGTVELGGVGNSGIVGADKNVGFGDGLEQAVRLGARVFFAGPDNDGAIGLWVTDGTASGTQEIGGIDDAGLKPLQHPSSIGLHPTDLTVFDAVVGVNAGPEVLFNGVDALGFNELWASNGTTTGTLEIGGQGVGGALADEAIDGLNPTDIVDLGNGKAVFFGYDKSSNTNSGRETLWVTDGTYAGTRELGGLNNLNLGGVNAANGLDLNTNSVLVGGDGLAYFIGEDSAGNNVLWQTDGTAGGTKIDAATDGNAPATGLYANEQTWALANPPTSATSIDSTSAQTINLNSIPGEDLNLSTSSGVTDTVTGSNGTINLTLGAIAAVGGGLLITMAGACAATLSNTNGVRDSVFMPKNNATAKKGSVTLSGAQANVSGQNATVTFAPNTTGNFVFLHDSQGTWDTVNGSNGEIELDSAKASVTGGGDTIFFISGTGNDVSLYGTGGKWDTVYADNAPIEVTASQVSVVGFSDTITATAGSSVSLYQTGGKWDLVNAKGAAVYLNATQASIVGGGNSITGTKGSTASLYTTAGAWDAFSGSSCALVLTNAQAAVSGGSNTITLADAVSSVSVAGTNNVWDAINAKGDTIILTTAQALVTGGGDTIYANSGSTVSLAGTAGAFDAVYGSYEGVILSAAQASILGGYNTIYANAGSTISLYNTAGHGDVLNATGDAIYLNAAQAVLNGSANVINFAGDCSLTANGNYEAMNFATKMGTDAISGFNSSDVLSLSKLDWGGFTALLGSVSQGASGAVITLDASDSITLAGIQKSALTAGEFKFV